MKTYKVTIYPVTPWSIRVEAKNEKEARIKALNLDGPDMCVHDDLDDWFHDITDWPNIGDKGEVFIEEDE